MEMAQAYAKAIVRTIPIYSRETDELYEPPVSE